MADRFYKGSEQVLMVDRTLPSRNSWSAGRAFTYVFDFEYRIMTAISDYGGSNEKSSLYPFSTLDDGLLARMRDKLVELGGAPDPLGAERKGSFAAPAALRGPSPGDKP